MGSVEINIQQISGKNTVSRHDGGVLYDKIKGLWKDFDRLTLDFGNLLIASVSFMDEVFGRLALEHPPDELRSKLRFINMSEFDQALLNDIVYSRTRQKDLSRRERPLPKQAAKRPSIKKSRQQKSRRAK